MCAYTNAHTHSTLSFTHTHCTERALRTYYTLWVVSSGFQTMLTCVIEYQKKKEERRRNRNKKSAQSVTSL